MAGALSGGCACGRVRYTVRIDNDDAYLCHCRMCQRATGGVSIAFKNVKKAEMTWESEPDWYVSSPIARRPYCRECGTSIGFEYPGGEKMDLTVGSFDDPSSFRPTSHFGAESIHRAWLNTEGLPETRSDEYPPLIERWTEAGGKAPE